MSPFDTSLMFFFSFTVSNSKDSESLPERRAVPELVLSLIDLPQEQSRPIADLSLPWAALLLLPHLR